MYHWPDVVAAAQLQDGNVVGTVSTTSSSGHEVEALALRSSKLLCVIAISAQHTHSNHMFILLQCVSFL